MGFFERLGRKTEAVKQRVESARAEEATHRCAECGEVLYTERETCPECGSAAVEELDGEAAGEAGGTVDDGAGETVDDAAGESSGEADGQVDEGATGASEDGEAIADADDAEER